MNTAMTEAWMLLLPLTTTDGPADKDVKAGWVALIVVLAMAAAVVFLFFSLRKHLGRVNFEEQEPRPRSRPSTPPTPDR